jgi:UDP-N-acetylmuramoylalanine--D-glutamate ligase
MESNLKLLPSQPLQQDESLVSFRNVTFSYTPDKEILHNVSFELKAGRTYAFVGPTGGGKTTTASLVFEILKLAGKNPVKVGVGQVSVLDKLDILKKDSVAVFELSSWRLSALKKEKLSPQISVITNIFPDHLNYYKKMENYLADKKNIFLHQKSKDWLIVNDDDENLKNISGEAKSQIMKISFNNKNEANSVFVENGAIYVNNGLDSKKIIDVSEIKISGKHNVYNAMLAIGASFAFGVSLENIKKGIINFSGVPHRLEFVRNFKGVNYYNDTAATIPDAAIQSLSCFSDPIILIAGGSDKKLEFSEFGKNIFEKAEKLILLKGSATEKLLPEIRKNDLENKFSNIPVVESMEKAVLEAEKMAVEGDVVLLSPGAASFGLFLNEFDRGEKFREAVKNLK